jgi:hypothetical protein
MEKELLKTYGQKHKSRITRGLHQVSTYWRATDGDQSTFEEFVRSNFTVDETTINAMFYRYQDHLEKINGHMDRIILNLREHADLDRGPLLSFDELFAGYNPAAHLTDDFFNNKLAFIVLLNFPLTTLDERSTAGKIWTRRQWAETRLASHFMERIPAEVNLEISRISSESDQYISGYNIWMHHLINEKGERLFPPQLRLLTHWNLRDEIKAQYADATDGLERQRMIQKVMESIVDQSIPESVIDNPFVDWNPYSGEVRPADVKDSEMPEPELKKDISKSEPDTRYLMLQQNFKGHRLADPYWPTMPSFIDRRFDISREIPESRVKEIFEKILTSSLLTDIAGLIKDRIGRDLEPFDIWYNGFKPRAKYSEQQLDELIAKKYPDASHFKKDIPTILRKLGFSAGRTREISRLISVDPARGSGHAWGAQMRDTETHLRTRIGSGGMDYKGYNIAIHELGHNVEQVISVNNIDYTLLQGVPNTAFTEAMAFVFQTRDLELLGLAKRDEFSTAMQTINDFWATCEIASVALVDIAIWHWMYDHPQATVSELKEAALSTSKNIWNTFFATIFNKRDITLLGIYSHMISYPLYLADYPLGHMIAYQIEERMKQSRSVGEEFDRMARIGNIAPDLWMMQATGNEVGPEALIKATEQALSNLRNGEK